MIRKKKPSSKSYDIGYGKPPKNHRFRRGESGNPSGKRRKASAPDLKAQLQSALNKTVTIRSGKHQKVMSKAAAGIDQLVDQFAAGDRNARRDLMAVAGELGIDWTAGHRQAIEVRTGRKPRGRRRRVARRLRAAPRRSLPSSG